MSERRQGTQTAGRVGLLQPLLLREREVVALLGVSVRTVRRLVKEGELTKVRVSPGTVRYRLSDLESLIQRSGGEPEGGDEPSSPPVT
jgi:excisionase family DNA binding protein